MSAFRRFKIAALLMFLLLPAAASGKSICSAASDNARVALLELYTSEGCDSCPPADRWLSALPQRGHTPQRVLALAFHVDYCNYLDWQDPYAQPRFSARQHDASRRHQARVVYTPQLLLDGTDYRRGSFRDDIGERIAAINSRMPSVRISATLDAEGDQQRLRGQVTMAAGTTHHAGQAYVAVYENNLINDVAAGENRGKRLRHDFVVRELHGPLAIGDTGRLDIDRILVRDRRWKAADLHVALFVQDAATGEGLQALSLPWCAAGVPAAR